MTENRLHIGNLGPGDIALLRNVADEAAEKTVRRWLVAMGLDPDQPIEAQRAFVMLREQAADPDFAQDAAWTRRTRKRSESMIGRALLTAVAISIASAAHSMWAGVKTLLAMPTGP